MSEALTYLVKARPETLGHYFAFLKDCGTRLDPKTRNLISVITKVHSQTEKGLEQYLKRALRDGCSGAEILDALLMAFPALGLAKIVWATDIILRMNLPEFRLEALDGIVKEASWHNLGKAAEIKRGATLRVDCDGRSVFVHRLDTAGKASYRVYDSLCPHQTTDIPHLALKGRQITCPKHKWVFDVSNGECVKKGDAPLKSWECKVDKGQLLARW